MFQNVREIIVLVPTLLDLKGNLDMSLASRMSTQVINYKIIVTIYMNYRNEKLKISLFIII